MKRLIVNADDFGISDRVNQGIILAHNKGIVTSTSIMANSPVFESSVKLLKKNKSLGVGVHLNLTEGDALVKSLNSITGRAGLLSNKNIALALRRRIDLHEVESEFDAQISKAVNAGIRVTHLDSHKHVHVFPGVQNVVLKLAKKHRIPCIRVPDDILANLGLAFSGQFAKRLLVKHFSIPFRKKVIKSGLRCADNFFGFLETGNLTVKHLANVLKSVPEGVSEVMCHPGYIDHLLKGRLVESRVVELNALLHSKTGEIIKRRGIELINYGDLR